MKMHLKTLFVLAAIGTLAACDGDGDDNGGGGGQGDLGATFDDAFDQGRTDEPINPQPGDLQVDRTAEPFDP